MKRALLSGVLCFFFIFMSIEESFAQGGIFSKRNKIMQYSSVGIGVGSSHYYGDLSPYRTFYYGLISNVRWNATLNYTRQLSPQVAARFAFTYARIAGDDFSYSKLNLAKFHSYYMRNLHFRNDIKEFTVSGLFNLLPQSGKGQQGRSAFMPYAVLGFGFYGHNPKARDVATVGPDGEITLGDWMPLKDLQTSGQGLGDTYPKSYSLVQVVVPMGLGLKMKFNEKIDINFEAGLRITPFDYLDDVGGTKYPDPNALATVTPDGVRFANRSIEDISARTGKSRIDDYVNVLGTYYNGPTGGTRPSNSALNYVGYAVGSDRGSSKWDSYLLFQVTLNYILGSNVKCPPIK